MSKDNPEQSSPSTAIARREGNGGLIAQTSEWEAIKEQAKALIRSKFYPRSVDTAEKAIMIMLTGRELNIPPMQAIRSIHVVDGRPTIAADLMLALVYQRIPGALITVKDLPDGCSVTAKRRDGEAQVFTFTKQDAVQAGLSSKDNWRKYPKAMYRARAISSAVRAVFPDAILGLYTPEEIESLEPEKNITAEARVIEPDQEPAQESEVPKEPTDPISEKERRRIFARWKERAEEMQIPKTEVESRLKAIILRFGYDSTTKIVRGDLDKILDAIDSYDVADVA